MDLLFETVKFTFPLYFGLETSEKCLIFSTITHDRDLIGTGDHDPKSPTLRSSLWLWVQIQIGTLFTKNGISFLLIEKTLTWMFTMPIKSEIQWNLGVGTKAV